VEEHGSEIAQLQAAMCMFLYHPHAPRVASVASHTSIAGLIGRHGRLPSCRCKPIVVFGTSDPVLDSLVEEGQEGVDLRRNPVVQVKTAPPNVWFSLI